MTEHNQFDSVTWVYDRLVYWVFGNRLMEATCAHFDQVKTTDKILVLGGGTGKMLDSLQHVASIDYVEKSKKMLAKASSRQNGKVYFIHADFLTGFPIDQYDVIICPFFLDVFDPAELLDVLQKIWAHVKPGGLLLVSDFSPSGNIRHKILLKAMYLFFKTFVKLSSASLLVIDEKTQDAGFELVKTTWISSEWIFSRIYRRKG